ncbi:MAG: hypothetical protein RRC07_11755 [Anaerolineae bacterium]|nr:hypothetical protein [Anaerolineae bacterium]
MMARRFALLLSVVSVLSIAAASGALAGNDQRHPAEAPPRWELPVAGGEVDQAPAVEVDGYTVWLPLLTRPRVQSEWVLHKTADGAHPSGHEQQMMWLMNRARANPRQEGVWLATSDHQEIAGPRDYFQVNVTLLQGEFASYAAKPPAAFDRRLYEAARQHSAYLISIDGQNHDGQFERVVAAGFHLAGARGNVFSFARSGIYAHAGFNIDWGTAPDGMQTGRGHRMAVMAVDGNYTNVGLAMVPENNPATSVGPLVTTGNYARAAEGYADHYNTFITGTVWRDVNDNGLYEPGEGVGGVTVRPDGGPYYALTAASGGYTVPILSPGDYVVTMGPPVGEQFPVTVASGSVLLDAVVP